MACASLYWSSGHADGFNSDRPGFEVSSQVVPRGHLQLETGFSVATDSTERSANFWNTPTLLRAGVAEDWELRLETDGVIASRFDDATGKYVSSFADITLGTKWHIHEAFGLVPTTALVTDVTLPTGSADVRGIGARPRLRVEMEWALPDDGTLGVLPGVVYDNNPTHHFVSPMLGVGYSRLWTQQFGTFVEVAGEQLVRAEDGGCLVTYGTGGTYLIGQKIQLDFSVSRGADRNAPPWTYGAGISIRF